MLTISTALKRHAREFVRAIKNRKFEKHESGLWFPEQGALVQGHGLYMTRVNGGEWQEDHNLMPTEGLTYMIGNAIGATAKISTWYVALYAGAVSPAANWTAANFTATASEITSESEGWAGANRGTFTAGTPAAAAVNNNSSPASFTIVTATQLSVNGGALISAQARGATTGTLFSAVRFGATRTLNNTDVFEVKYAGSLTSS